MAKVRTQDLLNRFKLELIAGEEGVHREIFVSEVSRPGIELTGYFKFYPKDRLQLLGRTELSFFTELEKEEKRDRSYKLCTDMTPGIVITRDMEVPEELVEACEVSGVRLFRDRKSTR